MKGLWDSGVEGREGVVEGGRFYWVVDEEVAWSMPMSPGGRFGWEEAAKVMVSVSCGHRSWCIIHS